MIMYTLIHKYKSSNQAIHVANLHFVTFYIKKKHGC